MTEDISGIAFLGVMFGIGIIMFSFQIGGWISNWSDRCDMEERHRIMRNDYDDEE